MINFWVDTVPAGGMAPLDSGTSVGKVITESGLPIKENIKAPRHLPLWWEFTGKIPRTRKTDAENVYRLWRHHVQKIGLSYWPTELLYYQWSNLVSAIVVGEATFNHTNVGGAIKLVIHKY